MLNSIHLSEADLREAPFLNEEGLSRDVGRTLVISPHPDDESLGCGGLIALLRRKEVPVWVVFVTNGAASHINSKTHPPHKLAETREDEAKIACSILGVHKDNIIFLREADSKLIHCSDDQINRLSEKISGILEKHSINTVLLPWRRDPHADHRVAHKIGQRALQLCQTKIQLVEYPIWLWKNGADKDWPLKNEVEAFRLDIAQIFKKKQKAIWSHKSQLGLTVKDDPEGFVLTEDLLEPFLTPSEYYFYSVDEKKSTLRKAYFEKLYKNDEDPWDFRGSTYERDKYRESIKLLKNTHYKKALEIGCSIGVQSGLLASICDQLLAVDISKAALHTAKQDFGYLENITFKNLDVNKNFPEGSFNLITLCEVGYYFNKKDLLKIFDRIEENLASGGKFLMVHWTSYVPDYPLTGSQVHRLFEKFNTENSHFFLKTQKKSRNYELLLWQKRA